MRTQRLNMLRSKMTEAERQRQATIDLLYDMLETLEGRRAVRRPTVIDFLFDLLERLVGNIVSAGLQRIPQLRRRRS